MFKKFINFVKFLTGFSIAALIYYAVHEANKEVGFFTMLCIILLFSFYITGIMVMRARWRLQKDIMFIIHSQHKVIETISKNQVLLKDSFVTAFNFKNDDFKEAKPNEGIVM